MTVTFEQLPGWAFDVEEVSAGVYRVSGHDGFGHRLSVSGVDVDELLNACKSDAEAIHEQSCREIHQE